MKTNSILPLSLCLVLSISVVSIRFLVSQKPDKLNGFVRVFQNTEPTELQSTDLQFNSYYIAGITDQNVYLANTTAPGIIACFNTISKNLTSLHLANPYSFKLAWNYTRLSVDSTRFYLSDLLSAKIYGGSLDDLIIREEHAIPVQRLSEVVVLGQSSYALKFFDTVSQQTVVGKWNERGPTINRAGQIIQKQADGIFSTDGKLYFSKNLNRLAYLYYYRNQFVTADTSLNIAFRGNTIDTVRFAHIHLDTLRKGHVVTISSPPLLVNRMADAFNDKLYIVSNLVADNEARKKFAYNSVIDIYSLYNGQYKASFYLPDFKKKKLSSFCVYNQSLIAMYGRYLVVFHLSS